MRILYHIPYPKALGADRWIYEGWRDAFVDMGHEFFEHTATDSLQERFVRVQPHIFMSAMNLLDPACDIPIVEAARKSGTKVFLWVHWPPDPGLEAWEGIIQAGGIADVFFGEREPGAMGDFEVISGRPYHVIANAANRKMHFPVAPVEKYRYDIVFLGANLPLKQQLFARILRPLQDKYSVGLFGPGWTMKDKLLRATQKLLRNVGMVGAANWINVRRITVPPEEERELYSSAKICLNFHEREPDGSQPHYILNQRTFKIAACGGFELCDHVPALRNYFSENEVVMASMDPDEWSEKIAYYIAHEDERARIAANASARALRDHTYHQRVAQVLGLYAAQQR